ncbi:MAG: class I SAM-dependent methyltransferase [Nostoc sp. LLA-1]|nr:class I SAM-dependent methyltransferase [Cyanocohniella sp. LLY]
MTNLSYIGSELELFREAKNWKSYWSLLIKRYIGNEVLEVGAGIGGTTELLCQRNHKRWICLEPDSALANRLNHSIVQGKLAECCEVKIGTLSDLHHEEKFDTIIYIDVLEHIKSDRQETKLAANHLKNGGFLVVLAPSHQWLFTPFDKSIGHYRRYNKKMLSDIIPESLECITLMYLDSIGLMASLGNRFILKSKMPTRKQILFWDKFMVPLSIKVDPLLQYSLGKSILGVWQKKVN